MSAAAARSVVRSAYVVRDAAARLSAGAKPASSPFRVLKQNTLSRRIFRLPAELGSVQSLMPLHSVTASALFTSLLSLNNDTWGCLSEGFATPL